MAAFVYITYFICVSTFELYRRYCVSASRTAATWFKDLSQLVSGGFVDWKFWKLCFWTFRWIVKVLGRVFVLIPQVVVLLSSAIGLSVMIVELSTVYMRVKEILEYIGKEVKFGPRR